MSSVRPQNSIQSASANSKVLNAPKARSCKVCHTEPLFDSTFFTHILGKRHIKNARNNGGSEASSKKSLCIEGHPRNAPYEVLKHFWPYGLVNAQLIGKIHYIEFDSRKNAEKAKQEQHVIKNKPVKLSFADELPRAEGRRLFGNRVKNPAANLDTFKLSQLNPNVYNNMKQIQNVTEVDNTILQLITDVELKPRDYQEREKIRFIMENFLRTVFPEAEAYIFGSSSNNLGFVGCDVDLCCNLGLNGEDRARDESITIFLAKEIRKRNRGYNVVPIPRARVPIVKFNDSSNGLQVDLSFKSSMPIYNTHLIQLYTNMHSIVRPYLMLLRFWAKVQNVAGGGKPDTHITNYSFVMMMIFWLMLKEDPIVPSVAELKKRFYNNRNFNFRQVIVNGWDCSFPKSTEPWQSKYHATTLIDLAVEFFDFYAQLDTGEWVISPFLGYLIKKGDMNSQNGTGLHPDFHPYCSANAFFPVDRPLCVQDPFELTHNLARGLTANSVNAFQYKCLQAAKICRKIKEEKAPLADLFEVIGPQENELENGDLDVSVVDETDGENISDDENMPDGTRDSIKLVEEVVLLGESNTSSGSLKKTLEAQHNSESRYKFTMKFECNREFSILDDGEINIIKDGCLSVNRSGVCISSFVSFILQNILKCRIQNTDNCSTSEENIDGHVSGKRKHSDCGETNRRKSHKGESGSRTHVKSNWEMIASYHCTCDKTLWDGRKQLSKQILQTNNSPLTYELSLTNMLLNMKGEDALTSNFSLAFEVTVWREQSNSNDIIVTCNYESADEKDHNKMNNFFIIFTKLTQSLAVKTCSYVKRCTKC